MSTMLVTGADGFVGRALVTRLQGLGHDVVALDVGTHDITLPYVPPRPIAHVFHLAGKTFIPDSWKDPASFYRVNTLGTINMLDLCVRERCALTFLSSYVYGPPDRIPVDESHPTRPNNPYSHSKLLGDEACRFYADKLGVAATVLRPFNIYGPGQRRDFLVPTIVEQVLDPTCTTVEVMDLEPRRDLLFIEDFIDAVVATIGGRGGVYNVGSGYSVSVADVVREALAAAGVQKPVRAVGQRRPDEILDLYADITKIGAELAWSPQTSFAEGIRRVVDAKR